MIDLIFEAGTVDGASPARWQWVYARFYITKMHGITSNSTGMDELAPLGFPQIIRVLTDTRSPRSLQYLLDDMFDPFSIAPQHIQLFLQGIAGNEAGLSLFNSWMQNNFASMITAIGAQQLPNFMNTVLSYNTEQADIDALTAFLQSQQGLPAIVRAAISAGLRNAAANVQWLNNNYQPILQFLQSGTWEKQ